MSLCRRQALWNSGKNSERLHGCKTLSDEWDYGMLLGSITKFFLTPVRANPLVLILLFIECILCVRIPDLYTSVKRAHASYCIINPLTEFTLLDSWANFLEVVTNGIFNG